MWFTNKTKKKSEEVFLHTANTHGMNGWNLVKMCKVPLTRIINAVSNSMLTMMVKQALKNRAVRLFFCIKWGKFILFMRL